MLKEHVRMMLHKVVDPLEQIELIDILQRLGLSHHFEGEMKRILEGLYNNDQSGDTWRKENLYATTLKFRLLRQHGYNISQGNLNIYIYIYIWLFKWNIFISNSPKMERVHLGKEFISWI